MSLANAMTSVRRRFGSVAFGRRAAMGTRRTIPAPTRGLNTRDPLASMRPDDAISLVNYFPNEGGVELRRGSRGFAVLSNGAAIDSLIPHLSGTSNRLIAAGGGGLYDISQGGTISTAIATGFNSSFWSHATVSGQTIMVNGADAPQRIQPDGTLAAAHEWTVTDKAQFDFTRLYKVLAFKKALFFAEKDSPRVYISSRSQIKGALTEFDLSFISPEGGNVLEIGTMTVDAGEGVDDLLLFFMDRGRVLVYQGNLFVTGEADARIAGEFQIPELVGNRPLQKFGGDLIAMTREGPVVMSQMISRGDIGRRILSDRITPTFRNDTQVYGDLDGWDLGYFPKLAWFVVNVPVAGGLQYVMNVRTKAWCEFRGMDARAWIDWNNRVLFGTQDGKIIEAGVEARSDDGANIRGEIATAYTYFKSTAQKKVGLLRALLQTSGTVTFSMATASDFQPFSDLETLITISQQGRKWARDDVATGIKWARDTVATGVKWASVLQQSETWQVVNNEGQTFSVRFSSDTQNAEIRFIAADVIVENADGIL